MSGSLLPLAKQIALDNSANPGVGYKFYTYEPGTLTQKVTYQDAALATPNTNPVIANARGEVTMYGEGLYRIILKTASDVTVWDRDNVDAGVSSANLSALNLADYAALRALANDVTRVYITGYLVTAAPSGIAGMFVRDDSDTTSADNGGTIIVASNGNRWKRVYSGSINVLWFGADPTGIAGCASAVRSARAAAIAASRSGNSGIYGSGLYVGTMPDVYFPNGVYKVDGALTDDVAQTVTYSTFTGENAILVADAGVTVFGGIGYDTKIRGFIFRGGACAISIKTGNIDTTRIDIQHNEFHRQTTACIQTDNASASTLLNINHNKFSQTAGNGYVGYFASGDQIYFENNWVSCSAQVAFYNAGTLNLRNVLGVPGGDLAAAGGRWIDNYNSVNIDNFRFGGENSGAPMVRNYADMDTTYPRIPTRVSMRNCPAYSTRYALEFYKLPNVVEFVGNHGFTDSDGFYFDASLTQTDFANFQKYGQFSADANWPSDFLDSVGSTGNQATGEAVILAALMRTGLLRPPATARLKESQIFGSGGFGGAWTSSGTCPSAYVADDYAVQVVQLSPSADDQNRLLSVNGYLSPTVLSANRLYTLAIVTEGVTVSVPYSATITIGGAEQTILIEKGRKVHCIPFVYLNNTGVANSAYDKIDIQIYNLKSGDVVRFGRHVLLEGLRDWRKDTLELSGTAAPTGYTNAIGSLNTGYAKGDISYRSNVAAAGFIGDVCTTAGAPGTWKTFGAVSA